MERAKEVREERAFQAEETASVDTPRKAVGMQLGQSGGEEGVRSERWGGGAVFGGLPRRW